MEEKIIPTSVIEADPYGLAFYENIKDVPNYEVEFVNLCPHPIKIMFPYQEVVIQPSGQIARVSVQEVVNYKLNNIPVVTTQYGEITGLPEPREGVVYIVSLIVRLAARELGREDVISPNTGKAIRDDQKRILYVPNFAE